MRTRNPRAPGLRPGPCSILLGLVLLHAVASPAAQRPAVRLYSQAVQLATKGQTELAVGRLQELIRDHPDDPMVDDALLQLGRIHEEASGDFDAAEAAYLRLIERSPGTRPALRARRRLERMEQDRATGDEPLRLYNRILSQYARMGEDEALARLEELYARYPDFTRRDHVLFSIAEARYRRKDYASALEAYNALLRQYPESTWAYYATGKIGRTYLEMRDFEAAVAAFQALSAFEGRHPGARQSSADQVRLVQRFRHLQTLFFVCLGVSVLGIVIGLAGTRWKEVDARSVRGALVDAALPGSVFVPAFFLVSSHPRIYGNTLLKAWIGLGFVAFLHHLFTTTRPASPRRRIVGTLGAVVVAFALTYAVYYDSDVVNILYDSIQTTLRGAG